MGSLDKDMALDAAAGDLEIHSALGLARLLQLASPALPVGAYSYSQGLEWAIEQGTVKDEDSARRWIADVLEFGLASFEAPLLWRLMRAWAANDAAAVWRWNRLFLAGRETAELRAETLQMGQALRTLLVKLPACAGAGHTGGCTLATLDSLEAVTFPAAYACAAHHMGIPHGQALIGYLWSWLENQVLAAVKAVPLGQTSGQAMLAVLGGNLPRVAGRAIALEDDELSNFTPGLAIASSRHETQYTRIFRS